MRGQVWWFSKSGSLKVASMVDDLSARGLAFKQPGSNREGIQVLDVAGDSREVEVDDLEALFASGEADTAALWLGPDTDIRFGPVEGPHRMLFDLDGLNWSEAQRVVFAVLACALGTPGTLGVVVDRNLPDTYEEWIRCFDHGTAIPYEPDLLLLASTAGNHNHALILRPDSWITHHPAPRAQGDV